MLGLIEDVAHIVRMGFQEAGDAVLLLGSDVAQPAATLGGSEYLAVAHGLESGPVAVDLDAEVALVRLLVQAARRDLLRSAHDCADGGLAVALAESAFAGGLGLDSGATALGDRRTAALFGEAGARAVVSVQPRDQQALSALAAEHGVAVTSFGTVGGDRLRIGADGVDLPLADAEAAYRGGLAQALGVPGGS